jgi:hypothetical protein
VEKEKEKEHKLDKKKSMGRLNWGRKVETVTAVEPGDESVSHLFAIIVGEVLIV